jgi:hypothetical protein
MHKGYAFVQFTNPFDARNACHGEDGRTVLSQVLGELKEENCSESPQFKLSANSLSPVELCEKFSHFYELSGLKKLFLVIRFV